jgi:prepilin-type N-terminal cleavage/methylation domain-containing protein
MRGFTLIEVATGLAILAVMTVVLVPVAGSLMDANRAGMTLEEMNRIHTAVVGDPTKGTFGYIGDTGKFPDSLIDLIQEPSSTPGWNGPYLVGARVESGVLLDPYGAPYECYYFADDSAGVTDQFAIMSAGQDRSSTNTAAANLCTNYNGTSMPANYGTTGTDVDNVVYPRYTDNASLLKFNHLGTLSINIMNFDDNTLVNDLVPGCPHLYTITITSVARGIDDQFSMPFNPGANSVDLPEGLYKVAIRSQTALGSLWEDQVAISPGATISRNINIYTGLNSSQTANQTFTPQNNMGVTIRVNEFLTNLGTVTDAMQGSFTTLNPCAQVLIRNNTTLAVLDAFTYPYENAQHRYSVFTHRP